MQRCAILKRALRKPWTHECLIWAVSHSSWRAEISSTGQAERIAATQLLADHNGRYPAELAQSLGTSTCGSNMIAEASWGECFRTSFIACHPFHDGLMVLFQEFATVLNELERLFSFLGLSANPNSYNLGVGKYQPHQLYLLIAVLNRGLIDTQMLSIQNVPVLGKFCCRS